MVLLPDGSYGVSPASSPTGGAGAVRESEQEAERRRVVKLDDQSQMAQFGATIYAEEDAAKSAPKVQWVESEQQRAWRESMDADGRHQRVSELARKTDGDSRAVSQLDAEYRYGEQVAKQVEKIQAEQAGEPGAPPPSQMLESAAAKKAREFQNDVMLRKLEVMAMSDEVRCLLPIVPNHNFFLTLHLSNCQERAALSAQGDDGELHKKRVGRPVTPNGVGVKPGPLGNQLIAVAAERAAARGATPASPTTQPGDASDDAEEELEALGDREVLFLRKAFRALDKDGDGRVGLRDLDAMLRFLQPEERRCSKAELRQMIFEVDDDCDGYMGWDDCSGCWVRGKQPLALKRTISAAPLGEKNTAYDRLAPSAVAYEPQAYEPRQMVDLLDFLVLDVSGHGGEVTGRIENTKMLELFRQRYGNVSDLLELTEETNIGDARLGISFAAYRGRCRRIHDAHFFAEQLGTTESLQQKKQVSRKPKGGRAKMTKREAKKKAKSNVAGFIVRTKDSTVRASPTLAPPPAPPLHNLILMLPRQGFYDDPHEGMRKLLRKGPGGQPRTPSPASPGGQMGHLPALGAALHSQAESDLRQSVAKSNRYVAERRKQRSRGGTRVRGLDELYRWAGVAPEHRVRTLPNRRSRRCGCVLTVAGLVAVGDAGAGVPDGGHEERDDPAEPDPRGLRDVRRQLHGHRAHVQPAAAGGPQDHLRAPPQHPLHSVLCRAMLCSSTVAQLRLLTAILRVGCGQDEEHEELLDLAMLVRQSCSPAHMESKRMQEERRMKPIMRDLSVTM